MHNLALNNCLISKHVGLVSGHCGKW